MALLTAVGTAALVLILWIPPHAKFAWSAALFCMLLDGIFYQPLGVLIDSAIIKILGDYKMMYYDSQRQWGDVAAAVMAVGIGWSLDDDHDFDTLMGTILIGAVLLFLVSLSTTVIPADPSLLESPEDDPNDHLTPLLKPAPTSPISPSSPTHHHQYYTHHHHHPSQHYVTTTNTNDLEASIHVMSQYYYEPRYFYKPYNLFHEQLSHISEEDASMLQQMASQHDTVKALQEETMTTEDETATTTSSHDAPLSPSARGQSDEPTFRSSSQYWATTTMAATSASTTANDIHTDAIFDAMPSLQLALMPSPPPETPMLILPVAMVPNGFFETDDDLDDERCRQRWPVCSLLVTVFSMGTVSAMMNALLYIYLHDGLGLPMHMIGIVGMVSTASKVAAKPIVQHWANRWCHRTVVVIHMVLILCALGYSMLQPAYLGVHVAVVVLQILQALAFNVFWYVAVQQVDAVLLTAGQHQRMILRGRMSALFNSIGPAIGAILAGYLVDLYQQTSYMTFPGFLLVYKCSIVVLAISLLLSRGWSLAIED
ncbi:hypothetical protein LRAMOSA01988 [Lichtheimia ramosa]|uniref:Major facilitator superfamily associated domain-containing protein n=1 Tax=Lichtheimia ramosa TaxID=688394 RepID=A0A077WLT9_9FUNG|nr:hypothetical protein LRAMOSA01988 [Lichtheimia ramosa]